MKLEKSVSENEKRKKKELREALLEDITRKSLEKVLLKIVAAT